jgi:predicted acyltransferase
MRPSSRLEAIDQYRGLAIVLMVLANFLAGVDWIPDWLKHAPDIGLTIADLVAPFFIFSIGLTYALSFRKRLERDGWRHCLTHFVVRYLALLGIGALLSAGESWIVGASNWGAMQAIGVAGLVTLSVVNLPSPARWALGLGLLAGYQFVLDRFWLEAVLRSSHGGLPGSLGWTAMLILATALADLYHNRKRQGKAFMLAAASVLALGLLVSVLVPISKNRVSASYVLISPGISALVFAAFHFLVDRARLRLLLLSSWGANPLLLYGLHFLLLGIFFLPGVPGWYAQAPLWLVSLQVMTVLGMLTAVSLALHRRNLVFSL